MIHDNVSLFLRRLDLRVLLCCLLLAGEGGERREGEGGCIVCLLGWVGDRSR